MIINTLALSGLWYTGSVVPLPAWAEKRINWIIFDFLWSGKNEQIKREVCYLSYELGGLKVVNVALKCKALLAKSVVFITDSQYKAKCVHMARYFIGRALGNFTSRGVFSGLTSNRMPGKLPRTISLLLQLLRTSRMCLSRSWGSLWQ